MSRIRQSRQEGKPLDLPSEASQLEEQRQASPRGVAAYTLGHGLYGSCSEEVWRVRRRMFKEPLLPIEETLRKRQVMQTSMSAPALFPGATSSPNTSQSLRQGSKRRTPSSPNTSQGLRQGSATGSRQTLRSAETSIQNITDTSVQSSWTLNEGAVSLVETCLKLCAWEDGSQSPSSRLPSGVQPAGAAISRLGGETFAPSAQLRPLPSELLDRIKDCGWTQLASGSGVWAQQARLLNSSLRASEPAAAHCRALDERLQLLKELEKQSVPQGIAALRAALKWRCGTLERAFLCLDVSDRQGLSSMSAMSKALMGTRATAGLSFLEFTGALALLGLDAPSLCGFTEPAAFEAMDTDRDGRLSLADLLGTSVPSIPLSGQQKRSERNSDADGIEGGVDRWVLAVKFAALSSWFATPVRLRRHSRPVLGQEPTAPLHVSRPETPAGGAMTVISAVAEGATGTGCASHGAAARQEVLDPVRQCWAPVDKDLKEVDEAMKAMFLRNASAKKHNEPFLNKSDFFRLLGDIPPVGVGDDLDAKRLTRAQLSNIFDEVQSLASNDATLSKGLTFESFRLALLKALVGMGLHFRHLLDDAIDTQVQIFKEER